MAREHFTFTDNRVKITFTRETYHKSSTGRSWQTKPVTTTSDVVSPEFYSNYVNSRYFFKSRVAYNYTPAGYIPVKLTTVSPFEPIKYVDRFSFEYDK